MSSIPPTRQTTPAALQFFSVVGPVVTTVVIVVDERDVGEEVVVEAMVAAGDAVESNNHFDLIL